MVGGGGESPRPPRLAHPTCCLSKTPSSAAAKDDGRMSRPKLNVSAPSSWRLLNMHGTASKLILLCADQFGAGTGAERNDAEMVICCRCRRRCCCRCWWCACCWCCCRPFASAGLDGVAVE